MRSGAWLLRRVIDEAFCATRNWIDRSPTILKSGPQENFQGHFEQCWWKTLQYRQATSWCSLSLSWSKDWEAESNWRLLQPPLGKRQPKAFFCSIQGFICVLTDTVGTQWTTRLLFPSVSQWPFPLFSLEFEGEATLFSATWVKTHCRAWGFYRQMFRS